MYTIQTIKNDAYLIKDGVPVLNIERYRREDFRIECMVDGKIIRVDYDNTIIAKEM